MSEMRREKMKTKVIVGPPEVLDAYGPSALMRFFIAAGGWSYSGFAVDISKYHKSQSVSLDSIGNWANNDVEPTQYRAALLRFMDDVVDASRVDAWRQAFVQVWSEHRARPKKRLESSTVRPLPHRHEDGIWRRVDRGRTRRGYDQRLRTSPTPSRQPTSEDRRRGRPNNSYPTSDNLVGKPKHGEKDNE